MSCMIPHRADFMVFSQLADVGVMAVRAYANGSELLLNIDKGRNNATSIVTIKLAPIMISRSLRGEREYRKPYVNLSWNL
jgi:hypothetical protein